MAAVTPTISAFACLPAAARVPGKVYPGGFEVSRFERLSGRQLADEIGRIDAIAKGAEAELKALKEEFVGRGLTNVGGDSFVVTATDQVAWRLDVKAVRDFLGAAATRFDRVGTSTVVRIRSQADYRASVLAR